MMVNLLSIKIMNVDCLIHRKKKFPISMAECTFSFDFSIAMNMQNIKSCTKYHIMSIADSIGTFVADVEGKFP